MVMVSPLSSVMEKGNGEGVGWGVTVGRGAGVAAGPHATSRLANRVAATANPMYLAILLDILLLSSGRREEGNRSPLPWVTGQGQRDKKPCLEIGRVTLGRRVPAPLPRRPNDTDSGCRPDSPLESHQELTVAGQCRTLTGFLIQASWAPPSRYSVLRCSNSEASLRNAAPYVNIRLLVKDSETGSSRWGIWGLGRR